ncbi:MAG: IS200/IS605 family element transposase accessory protein TnpB [Cyanothece sp. SIO2G6]|nr:IS200/IS605 family element transposase accessory protein TnpB [Cyanothece sp. SIO2G6]
MSPSRWTMIKTYTAELPKDLLPFVMAYGAKQGADRCAVLEVLQGGHSRTKQNQLVQALGYNKRQANSLLIDLEGKRQSCIECRTLHLETLAGKIRSAQDQIKKWEHQLEDWPYPVCRVRRNGFKTIQHELRFKIHQKRRYLIHQQRRLEALQQAPIEINFGPVNNFLFVGSQGESGGNQICQYDGQALKIRVPTEMEEQFGKYVSASLSFKYGQDAIQAALLRHAVNSKSGRIIEPGKGEALTWRLYEKQGRWYVAVSVDVTPVPTLNAPVQYGCIGVDLNPKIIGWAYVDGDGNLRAKGQIKLDLHSKRSGQVEAILFDAATKLCTLAIQHQCPIVVERLDFTAKKKSMREQGRRYARMLNYFAYSTWQEALARVCRNRGIEVIQVNPAYSSLIGLTKFMRMFGLSSDTAAALVLARRAMKLSESVPAHVASLVPKTRKHVWAAWYQLNRKLGGIRRHRFYQPGFTGQLSSCLVGGEPHGRSTRTPLEVKTSGEMPDGNPTTAVSSGCLEIVQLCLSF